MAKRTQKAPSAAGDSPAAEQLATLNPDLPLKIAGRAIVVREYGFFEGMKVAKEAEHFIADMHVMCKETGTLRYDRIRRLFGVHADVVVAIAAQAADVEPEWVRGLNRADAEAFMSAWFAVNVGFFLHEVVVEVHEDVQRELAAALARASTGSSSLPGSPPPDLAMSPTSGDAQSGS